MPAAISSPIMGLGHGLLQIQPSLKRARQENRLEERQDKVWDQSNKLFEMNEQIGRNNLDDQTATRIQEGLEFLDGTPSPSAVNSMLTNPGTSFSDHSEEGQKLVPPTQLPQVTVVAPETQSVPPNAQAPFPPGAPLNPPEPELEQVLPAEYTSGADFPDQSGSGSIRMPGRGLGLSLEPMMLSAGVQPSGRELRSPFTSTLGVAKAGAIMNPTEKVAPTGRKGMATVPVSKQGPLDMIIDTTVGRDTLNTLQSEYQKLWDRKELALARLDKKHGGRNVEDPAYQRDLYILARSFKPRFEKMSDRISSVSETIQKGQIGLLTQKALGFALQGDWKSAGEVYAGNPQYAPMAEFVSSMKEIPADPKDPNSTPMVQFGNGDKMRKEVALYFAQMKPEKAIEVWTKYGDNTEKFAHQLQAMEEKQKNAMAVMEERVKGAKDVAGIRAEGAGDARVEKRRLSLERSIGHLYEKRLIRRDEKGNEFVDRAVKAQLFKLMGELEDIESDGDKALLVPHPYREEIEAAGKRLPEGGASAGRGLSNQQGKQKEIETRKAKVAEDALKLKKTDYLAAYVKATNGKTLSREDKIEIDKKLRVQFGLPPPPVNK